jgi:branched-chain amino acid transport system permease protein
VAVQLVFFGMPAGQWVRGLTLGLLTALLAVGMALVYRANRVINFAQADLGFVPTSLAVGLIVFSGLPYLFGFAVGLAWRRSCSAPSSSWRSCAGSRRRRGWCSPSPRSASPSCWRRSRCSCHGCGTAAPPRSASRPGRLEAHDRRVDRHDPVGQRPHRDDRRPAAMIAVAVFLGTTRLGTAIRGSAERSERALMLGIPVAWLSTLVWSIAAGLSFLALFLRAGILGSRSAPRSACRRSCSRSPRWCSAGCATSRRSSRRDRARHPRVRRGLEREQPAARHTDHRRRRADRAAPAAPPVRPGRPRRGGGWRLADEIRALRPAVARLPLVRLHALGHGGAGPGRPGARPLLLRTDQIIKATAVVVFAVIGMSLVVLSGWAGQISLGQMAFVAIGAAVSAKCTIEWNVDITLALVAGGAAGAAAAFVVGLPALRLRGLYLAVTTLVFALAVNSWFLNRQFFGWVPQQRVERFPLFGRIDLSTPTRFYVFSLAVLAVVFLALRGVRRSRTGRAIVALRENELAAQAFSVAPVPAKLTAFTVSGAVAGVAGGLFVHLSQSFDLASYGAAESLNVFTAAVVGGLGSLFGGVLGAVFLRGSQWFITAAEWRLLSSAMGVLLVLLILPGGLASLVIKVRDRLVTLVVRASPSPSPTVRTRGPAPTATERTTAPGERPSPTARPPTIGRPV